MGQLIIGTGGWDYFSIPNGDRLKAYSSVYDFVEVNSTYYRLPSLTTIADWRSRVPSSFEFSLRCHRGLAERNRLEITPENIRLLDTVEKVCRRLRAIALALLIPSYLSEEKEFDSKIASLLSTLSLGQTKIAIEFRGGEPSRKTLKTIADYGALHSVDISVRSPEVESNVLYSRIFGKGKGNIYEFDDSELRDISKKASDLKFEKSILAFHGVRMYRDTARINTFLRSGAFPFLTGQVGLDALSSVLGEDTVFPMTRTQLIESQGWKLFDKNSKERVRVGPLLEALPERPYSSVEEIVGALDQKILS